MIAVLSLLFAVTDAAPTCAAPLAKSARHRVSRRNPTTAPVHPSTERIPVNELTTMTPSVTPAPLAPSPIASQPTTEHATPAEPETAPKPLATGGDRPRLLTSTPPVLGAPTPASPLTRVGLPLAALCAAALAIVAWQKHRRRARAPEAEIEVLASRSFGPKHRLSLVRVEGRRLLVSSSPEGMRLICALESNTESFEQALSAALPGLVNGAPIAAEPEQSPEIEGIVRLKRARQDRAGARS